MVFILFHAIKDFLNWEKKYKEKCRARFRSKGKELRQIVRGKKKVKQNERGM